MALESQLWNWLSKVRHDPAARGAIHLERVENFLGAGFPDVDGYALLDVTDQYAPSYIGASADKTHLQRVGIGFKLELKSSPRPVRAETPVRFKLKNRERQIEFMRKRFAMGEAAYFLLQVGEGAERRLYLAPGIYGADLKSGIIESELAILCATQGGMVFDRNAAPYQIIKGVWTCYTRSKAYRLKK